jgi:hypothetical protein
MSSGGNVDARLHKGSPGSSLHRSASRDAERWREMRPSWGLHRKLGARGPYPAWAAVVALPIVAASAQRAHREILPATNAKSQLLLALAYRLRGELRRRLRRRGPDEI